MIDIKCIPHKVNIPFSEISSSYYGSASFPINGQ